MCALGLRMEPKRPWENVPKAEKNDEKLLEKSQTCANGIRKGDIAIWLRDGKIKKLISALTGVGIRDRQIAAAYVFFT